MVAFLKIVLSFEAIQTFSTPRRLAVRVTGLADKQSRFDLSRDQQKIALDSDGNFTKAAQEFVCGKGLTVENVNSVKSKEGEEYMSMLPRKKWGNQLRMLFQECSRRLESHWLSLSCTGLTAALYTHPPCTFNCSFRWRRVCLDFLDIKGGRVEVVAIVSWDETKDSVSIKLQKEDLREQFVIADPRERETNDCWPNKSNRSWAWCTYQESDADLLNEVLNSWIPAHGKRCQIPWSFRKKFGNFDETQRYCCSWSGVNSYQTSFHSS